MSRKGKSSQGMKDGRVKCGKIRIIRIIIRKGHGLMKAKVFGLQVSQVAILFIGSRPNTPENGACIIKWPVLFSWPIVRCLIKSHQH